MAKTRVPPVLAIISAVVIGGLVLHFRRSDRVSTYTKTSELGEILESLAISLPSDTSTNKQEAWRESLKRRQNAMEKLRTNSQAFLPQLMQEVYAIGKVEVTDRRAAVARTERVALAFEVLGEDAKPLLPSLKDEFNAGRSIGATVAAFHYIGGTDCGLILLSGLTNSDPVIRKGAMSGLSGFATNRDIALSAVPPLLLLLKDNSPLSRALAASVLGSFSVDAKAVVPALLQVATNDVDFVPRTMAVKAIGRFGTNAVVAKPDLERLATSEQEPHVRRIASKALQAINGEIAPTQVQ